MAQIHALLFITGEPMSMDEIIEQLKISRGNASMNLRDLMDWGVVRRFREPGERRDTYVADTDALTMVSRVVRERKRRELDPTVEVLHTCLQLAKGDSEESRRFREKLSGLLEVFDLVDAAFEFTLSSDDRARWIFENRSYIKQVLSTLSERKAVE